MNLLRPTIARGVWNTLIKSKHSSASLLTAGARELSGAVCPRADTSAPILWVDPGKCRFSFAPRSNGFSHARVNPMPQLALQFNFLQRAAVAAASTAARPSASAPNAIAIYLAAEGAAPVSTARVRTASSSASARRKIPTAAKAKAATTKAATGKRKATSARRVAGKASRTQKVATRASTRRAPSSQRKAAEAKERAKERAREARAKARAKALEAKEKAKAREAKARVRARAKAKKQREAEAARRKEEAARARVRAKQAARIKRSPSAMNLFIKDRTAGKPAGVKGPSFKELAHLFKALPEAEKKKYVEMALQAKAETAKRRQERAKAWAATHTLAPYNIFFKEAFQQVRAENANLGPKDVAKVVAERWRALPTEGRRKYVDASEADRRAKGLTRSGMAAGATAR